ncbi:MAG: SocA family protein [Armatimonadetes bacterium]|nr:SocA family protein [Armatimonadota bacterium]
MEYKLDRAMAMTAFFLQKGGGEMNDIKLAKLQYLAERASLITLAERLTGDDLVSLEHGPCLSRTVNLETQKTPNANWRRHFGFRPHSPAQGTDNTVTLEKGMDIHEVLSEAEIEILEALWRKFGKMDKWAIKRWCHNNCKEYKEVGADNSAPIQLIDVLLAEGWDQPKAEAHLRDIEYYDSVSEQYGLKEGLA